MEGNEKEDGSNQWKEQLGVIFDECNMPVEFTAKEIHHIMNEFYRTWEGKEIFCLFKEASGSYRQEGKGFVEGNEIPDEQIIGKMENAYGAQVLVKNAAGWKQEGFVVDHASIEEILLKDLYNVKGFARQYVIVILAMAVWGVCMKNISFVSIYMVILGGMMSITTMSMDESSGFNKFYLTTCEE